MKRGQVNGMSYRRRRERDETLSKYKVSVYRASGVETEEFDDVYGALNYVHYIIEYEMAKGKCVGVYVGLKSR